MPERPAHGIWSRRWFRRVTYLIASGAALAGLVAWACSRPELDRWLIGQLDVFVRRETGLPVQAERLEIHPFEGRILLRRLTVGGDLLQAGLLEVDLEWLTLLRTPHIRRILLEDPVLNLDRARIDRIRLRPHPETSRTPQVLLDRLEISNGRAQVREAAWGIPQGVFLFEATGDGSSPNQLRVRLRLPGITLGQGRDAIQGRSALTANLTEQQLHLEQGQLQLGENRLDCKGDYRPRERALELEAKGHLDLVQVQRLASLAKPAKPAVTGTVDFQAQIKGPLDQPTWNGTLQGTRLQAKGVDLRPGNLLARIQGGPAEIRLDKLAWTCPEGSLGASGNWTARTGYLLKLEAGVPMAPVAGYTHAGFLKDLSASFQGEARLMAGLPQAPWAFPDLARLTFHGAGQFKQAGAQVGGLTVNLERSRFELPALDLEVPELAVHGRADGTLGPHGLATLEAQASLATDAQDVSGMLLAWDIGMTDDAGKQVAMDMAGAARVEAGMGWTPRGGLQLKAQMTVAQPRWHGARADQLKGAVSIDRDVLRVSDITLEKGTGKADGELWLTWGKVARGQDQIDMTYHAFNLPVQEGLKAADLDLPLYGTGSGSVRLHGPFDRILMEGQCQAGQAEVYGLRIPAASADFFMDIAGDRLRATAVRVADSPEHLGSGTDHPSGPLALQGSMDMDVKRQTWTVSLQGAVDSRILGLPGPDFQGQVEALLEGPLTAPLGPLVMPPGSLTLTQGRVTQSGQTLEGLEGSASFKDGELMVRLGLAGKPKRLLNLEARQQGPDRMNGTLDLEVGPDSADTAQLAARLTQDFMKDAHFQFHAQGDWNPKGLRWEGQMERFNGQFDGFYLIQAHPGRLSGDTTGMDVSMELQGRAPVAPVAPLASTPGPAGSPPGPAGPRRPRTLAATDIQLDGRFPFQPDGRMAFKLSGSSNLANLKTILDRVVQPGQYSLLADLHPEGNATFDLNLGGTLKESTLDGSLSLKGGRAVVHSYPVSLENLDFTAQFKGRDILIPKATPLRGNIAQGTLTAWGQLTWNLGGISAYDLHTSLEDFQLRDLPDGFELQGSLDANLKGSDRDGGLLSGSIWARRTLYRTEINLTDLIVANALGPAGHLSALDPSNPLARIELNLELHMAEPWELDTNLLKLQGRTRGPFWIRGNLVRPGLKGRMDLIPGGRLTNLFPAGDIVIEHGTVEFQDPSYFNPNLDIEGQIDIPPYLVTLEISGTMDALQAKPFSTPSLRQDEIFAILIDPAAVTQVGGAPSSSTQAAMNSGLASTSTGLLTSLALANFQEQLRKALSLDRVSVALRSGGTGTPETTFTVGKTVNLFGYHAPLVFTHDKTGEVTTISGQVEWRFGNYVFRLGASQSTADSLAPSGEIRHTWSPR